MPFVVVTAGFGVVESRVVGGGVLLARHRLLWVTDGVLMDYGMGDISQWLAGDGGGGGLTAGMRFQYDASRHRRDLVDRGEGLVLIGEVVDWRSDSGRVSLA